MEEKEIIINVNIPKDKYIDISKIDLKGTEEFEMLIGNLKEMLLDLRIPLNVREEYATKTLPLFK